MFIAKTAGARHCLALSFEGCAPCPHDVICRPTLVFGTTLTISTSAPQNALSSSAGILPAFFLNRDDERTPIPRIFSHSAVAPSRRSTGTSGDPSLCDGRRPTDPLGSPPIYQIGLDIPV